MDILKSCVIPMYLDRVVDNSQFPIFHLLPAWRTITTDMNIYIRVGPTLPCVRPCLCVSVCPEFCCFFTDLVLIKPIPVIWRVQPHVVYLIKHAWVHYSYPKGTVITMHLSSCQWSNAVKYRYYGYIKFIVWCIILRRSQFAGHMWGELTSPQYFASPKHAVVGLPEDYDSWSFCHAAET